MACSGAGAGRSGGGKLPVEGLRGRGGGRARGARGTGAGRACDGGAGAKGT